MHDLNRLNYLDQVIRESLRLYPSIPFYFRAMTEEVMLGKLTVPASTTVMISAYLLGRNPEVFPDPLQFNPSRFDVVTNNEKNNSFAFVPFSAGPRNCIGQKFAMLEIKCLVSKVVRNFKLSISKENENIQFVADIVLRTHDGIKLLVEPRNI